MKKIHFFSFLILLTACKKNVDITQEIDSEADTERAVLISKQPLLRTTVTLDATHFDSALVQMPFLSRTTKSPLLISFAGLGGRSAHGNLDVVDGVANKLRKGMTIPGNMIIVCPQNYTGYFPSNQINAIINHCIQNYPVDTNRIYLTGFSAGGYNVLNYITEKPENTKRIAAAVIISSLNIDATHLSQLKFIADENLPVRLYCGVNDGLFNNNKKYAETVNGFQPGLVQFIPYNGAHDHWSSIFSPTNKFYQPNMYQWMTQFKR